MKRSTDRILVTHVGSLVRPLAIRDVMWARERDKLLRRGGPSKRR